MQMHPFDPLRHINGHSRRCPESHDHTSLHPANYNDRVLVCVMCMHHIHADGVSLHPNNQEESQAVHHQGLDSNHDTFVPF